MDPNLENTLVQLAQLAARGLMSNGDLEKARDSAIQQSLRDTSDATRVQQGLPVAVFGPTVFPGAVVHLGSVAGATPPPQLQLAPQPQQRMAPRRRSRRRRPRTRRLPLLPLRLLRRSRRS